MGVRKGSGLGWMAFGVVYTTMVAVVVSIFDSKKNYAQEQKANPVSISDAGALNIESYLGNIIYDSALAELAGKEPSVNGDTLTWNRDEMSVSRTGCAPTAPVSYRITRTVDGSNLEARINVNPNVHYDPGTSKADLEKRYANIPDENERERLIAEHLIQRFYDASVNVNPITINGNNKGALVLSVQGSRSGEYTLTRRIRDNSEDAHVKESSETIKVSPSDADNLHVVYLHLEGLFNK